MTEGSSVLAGGLSAPSAKFPGDIELCDGVDMIEGQDAIQGDLGRLSSEPRTTS